MSRRQQTTTLTRPIAAIYKVSELFLAATCKDYLQVRLESYRNVKRSLKHDSLEMILAIGARVLKVILRIDFHTRSESSTGKGAH